MRSLSVSIATAALVLAGAAEAHPKLVSTSPMSNTTVARPAHVALRFSEKLMPAFSKANLTMVAMSGMPASKIASAVALAADGCTLVITPRTSLHAGRYSVAWHVVSTDTHKAAGTYAFAVK